MAVLAVVVVTMVVLAMVVLVKLASFVEDVSLVLVSPVLFSLEI